MYSNVGFTPYFGVQLGVQPLFQLPYNLCQSGIDRFVNLVSEIGSSTVNGIQNISNFAKHGIWDLAGCASNGFKSASSYLKSGKTEKKQKAFEPYRGPKIYKKGYKKEKLMKRKHQTNDGRNLNNLYNCRNAFNFSEPTMLFNRDEVRDKRSQVKITRQFDPSDLYRNPSMIEEGKYDPNLINVFQQKYPEYYCYPKLREIISFRPPFGNINLPFLPLPKMPLFIWKSVPKGYNPLVVSQTQEQTQVDPSSLQTLHYSNWLNDEVITKYIEMIVKRNNDHLDVYPEVYAFNSFFFSRLREDNGYNKVVRWTKKVNIFKKEMILVPINWDNQHWAMAIINFKRKRIEVYNSIHNQRVAEFIVNKLKYYLASERMDKKKEQFNFDGWTDYIPTNIPQQQNGSDCGVFTLMYAFFASRSVDMDIPYFPFNQNIIPMIRTKIHYEITYDKLLV